MKVYDMTTESLLSKVIRVPIIDKTQTIKSVQQIKGDKTMSFPGADIGSVNDSDVEENTKTKVY